MYWTLKTKYVVLASAIAATTLSSTYAKEDVNLQFIARFKTNKERKTFLAEKDSARLTVKSIHRSQSEVLKFESLDQKEAWEEAHKDLLDYLVEDTIIDISRIAGEPGPMAETIPYGIDMVKGSLIPDYDATSGISSCIIDSGYDFGHPDLQTTDVDGVGDLCTTNPCPWDQDTSGHGTHVTGTVAAIGGNSVGVIGVVGSGTMPIYVVRVFDSSGSTSTSNVIDAMYECDNFGANVVNMSLGSSFYNAAYDTAINTILAGNDSILFVAAAGNAGNGSYGYPASIPEFMSVGSVDSSKNRSYFSQFNDEIDIMGPGSSVYSTYPPNSYATLSGTSMATPHVVGVAALVWSHYPSLTATEVRSALEATAEDLGSTGYDVYYGNGLVDAEAAYNYIGALYGPTVSPAPTLNPTVSAEPTSSPAPTSSCFDVEIEILPDEWASGETSWKFIDTDGSVFDEGGLSEFSAYVLYTKSFLCLPSTCGTGLTYEFQINDNYGDGLNWSTTAPGYFRVYAAGVELFGSSNGIDFGYSDVVTVVDDCSVTTPAPTASPTPAPSVSPTITCVDSGFNVAFTGVGGGTSIPCEFVADYVSDCLCDDPDVASHCIAACDSCEAYGCVDSTAKFYTAVGGLASCAGLATLPPTDIATYCSTIPDIYNTCRGLCGAC